MKLTVRCSDAWRRRRCLCFLSLLVSSSSTGSRGSSTRTFACRDVTVISGGFFVHDVSSINIRDVPSINIRNVTLSLSSTSFFFCFLFFLRVLFSSKRLHTRRHEPQLMRPHGSIDLSLVAIIMAMDLKRNRFVADDSPTCLDRSSNDVFKPK